MGPGQLQEELPGINGALDLGCQTTSGTSGVLRRAIFVPRVNQSFDQDLGSCLTLAKLRDLSASGTSHDVTEAEIHPGRTQMKRQCFQPGRKQFRIWGCRNKYGASYCCIHPFRKADSGQQNTGQRTLGSLRLPEWRQIGNLREAM